jgi:hypothetical protein
MVWLVKLQAFSEVYINFADVPQCQHIAPKQVASRETIGNLVRLRTTAHCEKEIIVVEYRAADVLAFKDISYFLDTWGT